MRETVLLFLKDGTKLMDNEMLHLLAKVNFSVKGPQFLFFNYDSTKFHSHNWSGNLWSGIA